MKQIIAIVFLINFSHWCFGQDKDSVFFRIVKLNSDDNSTSYSIKVFNFNSNPICVLHSASIHIFQTPIPSLIPYYESDNYSLNYAAKDTLIDDLPETHNLNAQIVLPLQNISFDLALLKSEKAKVLKVEFLILEHLCYNDFIRAIFRNAADWYKPHKRIPIYLAIPD